ncbi:hypothetical protein VB10N_28520 [Vibrio sp. 10N]|nr:hypothetical protein VB10N_28520 [Vibrio sp. 10N]
MEFKGGKGGSRENMVLGPREKFGLGGEKNSLYKNHKISSQYIVISLKKEISHSA